MHKYLCIRRQEVTTGYNLPRISWFSNSVNETRFALTAASYRFTKLVHKQHELTNW
jgi:hypothetical protein